MQNAKQNLIQVVAKQNAGARSRLAAQQQEVCIIGPCYCLFCSLQTVDVNKPHLKWLRMSPKLFYHSLFCLGGSEIVIFVEGLLRLQMFQH